jgi:hypothetical protein
MLWILADEGHVTGWRLVGSPSAWNLDMMRTLTLISPGPACLGSFLSSCLQLAQAEHQQLEVVGQQPLCVPCLPWVVSQNYPRSRTTQNNYYSTRADHHNNCNQRLMHLSMQCKSRPSMNGTARLTDITPLLEWSRDNHTWLLLQVQSRCIIRTVWPTAGGA